MKTQFILATVLSLASVSAMAQPHHKHHRPHHRGDKVVVIKEYHQPRISSRHHHARVAPRYYRPAPHPVVVAPRPVIVVPPAPRVYYAPPRPVPLRPSANFSLSVNL